jgi:hypothetical protein
VIILVCTLLCRHVLGILVMAAQILIWALYFIIELYAGMKHYQGRSAPVLLAFVIIIGFVMYVLVPAVVLQKELIASINDTSTSDSHELLMEANDESKPFLNKVDIDSLESGTFHGSTPSQTTGPTTLSSRQQRLNSDSSMEQMLAMSARVPRRAAPSPLTDISDDASLASAASTRSFLLSLGADASDGSTEYELYRARQASAFVGRERGEKVGGTPLYADKYATKPSGGISSARKELQGEEAGEGKRDDDDDEGFAEAGDMGTLPAGALFPINPLPTSPFGRLVSPTRIRSPGVPAVPPTIPEESRLSLYSTSTTSGRPPMTPTVSSSDALSSFLRRRAAAPMRPRSARDPAGQGNVMNRAVAGGINQVAAATAAMDPNKVLPMLLNLGVSSVEAAGMMTYLMRVKELGDGKKKKKKNSLAMVV